MSIVIITIIVLGTIISVKSIYSIMTLTKENIEDYKVNAYSQKENELRSYVKMAQKVVKDFYEKTKKEKIQFTVESSLKEQTDFVFSLLNSQYEKNKNKMPKQQLQKRLIEIVKGFKYGEAGYFFINDFDYKIVAHPIRPEDEGKSFLDVRDKNGVAFIKILTDEIKKGNTDSLVNYVWKKPSTNSYETKVSYAKVFKPYNWIITTGAYLDDLTEQMKEESLEALSQMRYAKNGYFWVNDSRPVLIMNPNSKDEIGKNLASATDSKGKKYFQEFVKVAKSQKEGLVSYYKNKPGETQAKEKLSYIAYFEPWDWIIGTGTYIEDIEKNIEKMTKLAEEEINSAILQVVVISVVAVIIIALLISFLLNKILVEPIEDLKSGLLEFFKFLNHESKEVKQLEIFANDEIGHMSKMVNDNIKNTKKVIEQDQIVIDEVSNLVNHISSGELSGRIENSSLNPSIKQLIVVFNEMMEHLQEIVKHSLYVIKKYQQNDFRVETTMKCKGELCDLMNGINDLGHTISDMLVENKKNGLTLNESAKVLRSNVDVLNNSSQESASSLEETAAALEQITSNIRENVEHIKTMSEYAQVLNNSSKEGNTLATRTSASMDQIDEQVHSINEAILVIDQIAFQTNILSLNAAVEAATAGEAGKGFAVVAQEVRNLASRSAEAAREIKEIVENATIKANEGKTIADEMIKGYESLNENINKTISLIEDVTGASKEQQLGIEQINDAINELDQQTQQNANVALKTKDVAIQTSTISQRIVDNADDKEFVGKDEVKAMKL
ncbi:methyl-accepting chemotaxis protein [Malaciobacter halophilus]|uniref:methyl-accepting chemotaxis protein n=1 Tax=Malaciobacter halophilus TaxID=197482 RepID=UPI0013C51349|nr:cache domain-containing protein [Malaciobacter halophilus]